MSLRQTPRCPTSMVAALLSLPRTQLCIVLLLAMQGATGQVVTPKQVGMLPPRLACMAPGSPPSTLSCVAAVCGVWAVGLLHPSCQPLPRAQAEITWRVQFAVGAAICLGLTVYRWTLLQASPLQVAAQEGRLLKHGHDSLHGLLHVPAAVPCSSRWLHGGGALSAARSSWLPGTGEQGVEGRAA